MLRLATCIALVTGCDYAFRIDKVSAIDIDAAIDAPAQPILFVNNESNVCSATTCSVTADIIPGDLIVVTFSSNNPVSNFSSVSDTVGNVFEPVAPPSSWPLSPYRTEQWYVRNAIGGTKVTVTAHVAGTGTFVYLYVDEYMGASTSDPLDQVSVASGTTGDMVSSGAKQIQSNRELIFGHAEGMGVSVTGGPGFTVRSLVGGNTEEDRTVMAIDTYEATFMVSPPGEWIAMMTTFR
ncbi:MAG TPA: hypothetical protein VLB44_07015 [Kofleriaceae bacterium]|nr:hypothetical protein [Kofleriaceae bacterium]